MVDWLLELQVRSGSVRGPIMVDGRETDGRGTIGRFL